MTKVAQNPLGFSCPANGAAADVIAEHDFKNFLAYGFLRCYADLSPDSFTLHKMVDDQHVRELREAFLTVVETTLQFLWTGEFEVGQSDFDADQFGDGTRINIGNSDKGDENEVMFSWMPTIIEENVITFEMYCSVLCGDGDGGDSITLFLSMDAVVDRQKVRRDISNARAINKSEYRTDYQEQQNDKLWEEVLNYTFDSSTEVVAVKSIETTTTKGYRFSDVKIQMPHHDTDVVLLMPNGKEVTVQYRMEGPSIDVCLPETLVVTNWDIEDQPHVRKTDQICVELPDVYLDKCK